jgi:hypothetical protein
MDTVVCLTLDKWETVSGQFGGYLKAFIAEPRHLQVALGRQIALMEDGSKQFDQARGNDRQSLQRPLYLSQG